MQPEDVGDVRIPMPILQALSSDGVALERAFSPHGICTPARHALLTGRLASRSLPARRTTTELTGRLAYRNRSRLISYNGSVATLLRLPGLQAERMPVSVDFDATFARGRPVTSVATHMAAHGLSTGFFGKWHLSDLPGSTTIALCAGGKLSFTNATYGQVRADVHAAGFLHVGALYPCNVPNAIGATPYSHNMEWVTNEAMAFIRAAIQQRRRFFACVAFTLPHGPDPHAAMLRPVSETPLPFRDRRWPTAEARRQRQHVRARVTETLRQTIAWNSSKSPSRRRQRVAALTWLDEGISQLLGCLERAAVANSTLVVFTADHGKSPKYSCLPGGLRVPLMLRWPNVLSPTGTIRGPLVSHLDLLPTLLNAVTTRKRKIRTGTLDAGGLQGRFLLELEEGQDFMPILIRPRAQGRMLVPCETFFDRGIIADESTLVWRALEPTRLLGPAEARAKVVRASQPPAWYDWPLQLYMGRPENPSNLAVNKVEVSGSNKIPEIERRLEPSAGSLPLSYALSVLLNASALGLRRELWSARAVWSLQNLSVSETIVI